MTGKRYYKAGFVLDLESGKSIKFFKDYNSDGDEINKISVLSNGYIGVTYQQKNTSKAIPNRYSIFDAERGQSLKLYNGQEAEEGYPAQGLYYN